MGAVYTRESAAALMGISLRTIDRLIATKALGFSKVGRAVRIQQKDVETYLDRNRIKTDSELLEIVKKRGVALKKK